MIDGQLGGREQVGQGRRMSDSAAQCAELTPVMRENGHALGRSCAFTVLFGDPRTVIREGPCRAYQLLPC